MRKHLIAIASIVMLISSCITIERIDNKSKIVDTTIVKKEKDTKPEQPKDDKSDKLDNKTNEEILKKKKAIEEVFDRNKRKYNYNLKGLWVASVNNLDFPQKPGMTIAELKSEFVKILDNMKKWNFNAIFYQVKPGADAIYQTDFWPNSRYLTGDERLKLREDILPFMIEEAHKRGIEFHAWINPYRASQSSDLSKISPHSIVKRKPEWTFEYGKKLFLNPGIPSVVDYVSRSIEEIVRKYDVDGVHLDDYFYPYPVDGEVIKDEEQYKQYGSKFATIEDWRRNNVNEMIKNLSVSVHKIKPNIVFGVSPFGIWRNKSTDIRGSETQGLESYDNLYADSILWMEKGWVDYIMPQIYWNIGKKGSDYSTLVQWWNKEALRTNTILYPGIGIYKYSDKEKDHWYNLYEVTNQQNLNKQLKGVKGAVYFRYGILLEVPMIIDQIK